MYVILYIHDGQMSRKNMGKIAIEKSILFSYD